MTIRRLSKHLCNYWLLLLTAVSAVIGLYLIVFNHLNQPPQRPKIQPRLQDQQLQQRQMEPRDYPSGTTVEKRVIVLDWTGFMGTKLPLSSRNYMAACPGLVNSCEFTADRSKATISNGILFHFQDIRIDDLPKDRHAWQRYVFFSHEPATLTSLPESLPKHYFNWTMTMSLKSDVPWPYARLVPATIAVEQAADKPTLISEDKFQRKTKWIAWFVSRCNSDSHRELFVKELQKHIPVDVYGNCGPLKCPHGEQCRRMVENDYKFYLALENSVCDSYITEKYWWFVPRDVVVIVHSRRVMDAAKLPGNSYIALDDFQSPKQLAQYLKRVGTDRSQYSQYFDWKRNISVLKDESDAEVGICKLCNLLIDEVRDRKSTNAINNAKTYEDAASWYTNISNCDHGRLVEKILLNGS